MAMDTTEREAVSIVQGLSLIDEELGALTIPGYLREVSERYTEREALIMHVDDRVIRWTYSQLWEASLDVARALVASGVVKDARIGILMTNRPEFLSAFFGVAIAGGVPVPLSTFSTSAELQQLLSLSNISILLFEGRVLKKDFGAALVELEPGIRSSLPLNSSVFPFLTQLIRLSSLEDDSLSPEDAHFVSWDDFLARGKSIPRRLVESRAATVAPGDIGGLFFSSGTTSLPKGILHTQRAFAIQWWRYPRLMKTEGPVRSWTGNGFFWSGNITMTVGLAFSTGGAIVLQPYFEPEATLRLIERERIEFLSGRPHQWARLREAPNWSSADLSSLRYITRNELLQVHPTVNTDWTVPMAYGNTETMSINTSNVYNAEAQEPPGSFGVPCPGNILKIVDPETGRLLPRGSRGEICIKGPTLMLGYLGKSIEETFDEEGYFCTGDGGYADTAGRLFFEGRLTEIIKTGGANVSPLEIDAALALYPGVKRAQTVGVPHETLGEMIVSCLVAQDGQALDTGNMVSFLKERLASYKIPKEFLFVSEEEISVTGSGKVKVMALRDLVAQRLAKRGS